MTLRKAVAEFVMTPNESNKEFLAQEYAKSVLSHVDAQTELELLVLRFLRGRANNKHLRDFIMRKK